jgi:hypothetical protein
VNDDSGTWNARWNGADQTDGYGDPAYPDGAERFRTGPRSWMGVVDDPAHGKPAWIRRAFAALRSGRYLRLRAAVWWNTDSGGLDTRIDSSAAASLPFAPGRADACSRRDRGSRATAGRATPEGLSASATGAAIGLSWRPIPNAVAYEAWRSGVRVATTTEPPNETGRLCPAVGTGTLSARSFARTRGGPSATVLAQRASKIGRS